MCMQGLAFGFVHAVIIVTVSFFVLLAAVKSDSQALKTFGFVIAVFLWIAAALVLGKSLSGRSMMNKMCAMPSKGCCTSMMGGNMSQMNMPGK